MSIVDRIPKSLPCDLARALNGGPVLRVVTGSHLHGFAGPDSDVDAWAIVTEPRDHNPSFAARKIHQAIEAHENGPDTDITVAGLSTWLYYCAQGIPQALDVMFATGDCVEVDLFPAMRAGFCANPNAATASFRRMMRQIYLNRADETKQRRHAFRLALNLRHIQETGRYQPTLALGHRQWIRGQAVDRVGFEERLRAFTGLDFANERC